MFLIMYNKIINKIRTIISKNNGIYKNMKNIVVENKLDKMSELEKINTNKMIDTRYREIGDLLFADSNNIEELVLSGDIYKRYEAVGEIFNNYLSSKLYSAQHPVFLKVLDELLNKNYDAIVLFHTNFGWNIEMKQRPQHIAKSLASKNVLYLYKSDIIQDKDVFSLKQEGENLYLLNLGNWAMSEAFFEIISKINIPKFVHVYATCLHGVGYEVIKKYIQIGFKVIYDFVDEFSEHLSGVPVTESILNAHRMLLENKENVLVISTAEKLQEVVNEIRGEKNSILAPNGVNLEDFKIETKEIPEKLKPVLAKGKPIIGYFGALARWFDYELIEKLAKDRPQYEIVLLGIKYDGSYEKSNLNSLGNVNYMGTVEHSQLINYARYFNVSTIPFKVNDITEATSPVKLFEYMAIGKPIVTTNLRECRKYKSCKIGKNHDEFINYIDDAINYLSMDKEYNELILKESQENTWDNRAEKIKDAMMKLV